MRSAYENASVVNRYITEELSAERISPVKQQQPGALPMLVHSSPFGVIPKKSSPGKWRLIIDLSSPSEGSVNDGIAPPLCSLSYPTVHKAARLAQSLGKGALLAKLDLQNAYRIVPVHPADRWLLGMQWEGQQLVDGALPFGLRSAPKIFTALADALQWIMEQEGVTMVIHYLDDFLFLGPPLSQTCAKNLNLALTICSRLGVPVATHKTEGPSTCLIFLGIIIDTQNAILRLPADKLRALKSACKMWLGRHSSSTKCELQSLLGSLNHAASVIGPGRTFLRGLISRLPLARAQHHHIRLNAEARADLQWWLLFADQWNGVNYLPPLSPSAHLVSDASGAWGCGAYWVVPAGMARRMARGKYCYQRACPYCSRCSPLGRLMAGFSSSLSL